jgi:1,2-diacylglycerol 3-alpha-glucosyltransferase
LYAPKTPGQYKDSPQVHRFHSVPLIFQPEVRFSVPIDYKLLRLLLSEEFSIIHSYTTGPLGLLAAQVGKLKGVPHFHMFYTYLPDYTHYIFGGRVLNEQTINLFSRLWCNSMDYIIAPSAKVEEWLNDIGVKKPIRIIPGGINTEKFKNREEDYLVKEGYVRKEDRVMLYTGRIAKEKSIDTLIDYFAAFIKATGDEKMKLVVVGGGPELDALKELASYLGLNEKIVFTGYISVDRIPAVYQSADVFGFMSTSETQGLVVAEAAASGLPLLVAADKAYDSVVKEGENGFYIKNEDEFIKKLGRVLENVNIKNQMGEKSVLLAQAIDIRQTTARLLEYYEEGVEEWKHKALKSGRMSVANFRSMMSKRLLELQEKIKKDV